MRVRIVLRFLVWECEGFLFGVCADYVREMLIFGVFNGWFMNNLRNFYKNMEIFSAVKIFVRWENLLK